MKKFNLFLTKPFLKERKFRRSLFTIDGVSSRLFYKVIKPFFILIDREGQIMIYRIPPRTKIRSFPHEDSPKPLGVMPASPADFDFMLEWCNPLKANTNTQPSNS